MKNRIEKPKTKEQFAEMLRSAYGYSTELSDELAGIVAGHGAFNPVLHDDEAMAALRTIQKLGYSPEELAKAYEAIHEF